MISHEGIKRLAIVIAATVGMTVLLICLEKKLTFGTLILSLVLALFAVGALWGLCQTVWWVLRGLRDEPKDRP